MNIKNGDLPAMPNITSHGIATSERELAEMLSEGRVTIGLTKREMFAIDFAAAMVANPNLDSNVSATGVAKYAIEHADALLAELERTK